MAKIYKQAKDKNVANNIIYVDIFTGEGGAGEGYACSDKEHSHRMTKDELIDAFYKGALFVAEGEMINGGNLSIYGMNSQEYATIVFPSGSINISNLTRLAVYSSEK